MRFTHALTLAALAGATLQAHAQTTRPRSGDVRILRAPSIRVATGFGSESRAVLGLGTQVTGTPRDTLGLLITSITRNSPAERAGLEEGNRIAAVNGVSLRANAADLPDAAISNSLSHRLTRELDKVKPGDEVELQVYRDGRTRNVRLKTAANDSLLQRRDIVRISRAEMDDRPALGFGIGGSGSRRDTLGVLVVSVQDSTPAAAAGLEEGNRIAAINGVDLRVAREDAGDNYMTNARAQRLMREVSTLEPGNDVTLRVYSDGRFRDLKLKVARAGDLPRSRGATIFGGAGMMSPMPPMPPMPPMAWPTSDMHFEIGPQIEDALRQAGLQLERVRPQLERVLRELPNTLENIKVPTVTLEVIV